MEISKIATHLLVTGGLLSLLVLAFLALFLIPGILHWFRLRKIFAGITSFKSKTPPGEFKKLFATDKHLALLWAEYQESLHVQREEFAGQMQVVAVRSTVAAETYLNGHFVVDSRLHTEFFKHLPGIFTGLGIIGTFTGLIEGLRNFQVSENAASVRSSLESLMHSVGEAFLISAAAITAAMVVTFLEKLLLAALYRKTEAIAHGIDARFEAGAGEEYLSRLVSATVASSSQSKTLKDALVKEIGDLLRELGAAQLSSGHQRHAQLIQRIDDAANRQLAAAREHSQTLGDVIAGSIERSMERSIERGLKEPLDKIANAVQSASADQSETTVKMLDAVVSRFSQSLNELFGSQTSGMQALSQQSAAGMQDTVAALNALVGKLADSGKQSADGMAAQIAASLKAMEERQTRMSTQTQAFLDQLRQGAQSSEAETQTKLQATLEAIAGQMASMMGKLNESQAKVFEDNRTREQSMADRTSNFVGELTGSIETAIKEISAASTTMAQSVSTLSMATSSNVDKMSAGAAKLDSAATNLAAAGERVSGVMHQTGVVSGKLTELSNSLTSSATVLQDVLGDYKAQRDWLTTLLAEVREVVELSKKEVGLTGAVLQRIDVSMTKLGKAQKAADEYLDGVSLVLANSNDAFRESVVSTLAKVNHDFHVKLSSAVGLLSTAVQELEVTLSSIAPRR